MKKKILHLIQSLENGGCENFLLRALPRLTGFNQKILTLKCRGSLAEEFEKRGILVESLNGKWVRLIREVKNFDPDIVVTYLFHADLLGRMYLGLLTKYKPIPYLRTTYNFPRYRWVRLFEKLTSFMVSSCLANSNSVKFFYVNKLGVRAQKITVISNGINTRNFGLRKNVREVFRKKMGVKSDDVVITCVANLHPNKGHRFLLEAFEKVYQKNSNVWLWLVGDGEERRKMEKMVSGFESEEKIVFWGIRRDVPVILGSSDIFVLPTLFEGMSNAILEAMASGLPVVTTDIAENRELIEEGVDGVLYDWERRGKLGEVLGRLVKDLGLRKRLGVNARKKAKKIYDIRVVGKKLDCFYNNAAKG